MTLTIALPDQANYPENTVNLVATVSGGTPPYTITDPSGSLPKGVSVDNDGKITGTISNTAAPGDKQTTLQVEDAASPSASDSVTFTWTIYGLKLTTPKDQAHSQSESISTVELKPEGTSPYTFTPKGDSLPPGLSLDSTIGEISGTVDAGANIGHYAIAYEVVDHNNSKGFVEFNWSVSEPTEKHEGSWYKLMVPDYHPDSDVTKTSYLRLGAADVKNEINKLDIVKKLGDEILPKEDQVPESIRLYAGELNKDVTEPSTKKTRPGWLAYTDGDRTEYTGGSNFSYTAGNWTDRIKGAKREEALGDKLQCNYGSTYGIFCGYNKWDLCLSAMTGSASAGGAKLSVDANVVPVSWTLSGLEFGYSWAKFKYSKSEGIDLQEAPEFKQKADETIHFEIQDKDEKTKKLEKALDVAGYVQGATAGLSVGAVALGGIIAGLMAQPKRFGKANEIEQGVTGSLVGAGMGLWAASAAYVLVAKSRYMRLKKSHKPLMYKMLGVPPVVSEIKMDKQEIILRVGKSKVVIAEDGIEIHAPKVKYYSKDKFVSALSDRGIYLGKGDISAFRGSVYAEKSLITNEIACAKGGADLNVPLVRRIFNKPPPAPPRKS